MRALLRSLCNLNYECLITRLGATSNVSVRRDVYSLRTYCTNYAVGIRSTLVYDGGLYMLQGLFRVSVNAINQSKTANSTALRLTATRRVRTFVRDLAFRQAGRAIPTSNHYGNVATVDYRRLVNHDMVSVKRANFRDDRLHRRWKNHCLTVRAFATSFVRLNSNRVFHYRYVKGASNSSFASNDTYTVAICSKRGGNEEVADLVVWRMDSGVVVPVAVPRAGVSFFQFCRTLPWAVVCDPVVFVASRFWIYDFVLARVLNLNVVRGHSFAFVGVPATRVEVFYSRLIVGRVVGGSNVGFVKAAVLNVRRHAVCTVFFNGGHCQDARYAQLDRLRYVEGDYD